MEDLFAVRAALANAIDEVYLAVDQVRAAQEVEWVSVFATRYREELYSVLQDLASFRTGLESLWTAVT